MNKINDGGPAFPNMDKDQGLCCLGMTLRDWFAGQALMGLCSNAYTKKDFALLPSECYKFADAMIKERDER